MKLKGTFLKKGKNGYDEDYEIKWARDDGERVRNDR